MIKALHLWLFAEPKTLTISEFNYSAGIFGEFTHAISTFYRSV